MDRPTLNWECKSFAALSPLELYKIMAARQAVFVVEQQCFYHDADFADPECLHLCAWQNEELAAYVRIVPPGLKYEEAAIGRVLTTAIARGQGLGVELMRRAIQATHDYYGIHPIRIGAQFHLRRFYSSLGFEDASESYDEDGIPHIEMLRPAQPLSISP